MSPAISATSVMVVRETTVSRETAYRREKRRAQEITAAALSIGAKRFDRRNWDVDGVTVSTKAMLKLAAKAQTNNETSARMAEFRDAIVATGAPILTAKHRATA